VSFVYVASVCHSSSASIIIYSVARELGVYVFMSVARYFSPMLTKIGMLQQHLVEVSELNGTCAVV
jgi:hypothetical protein